MNEIEIELGAAAIGIGIGFNLLIDCVVHKLLDHHRFVINKVGRQQLDAVHIPDICRIHDFSV